MTIDQLLDYEPFSLPNSQKEKLFLGLIAESVRWHWQNSREFRNICKMYNFNPFSKFSTEELPFLPVSLFKKFELLSVPKKQIVKTLFSSSTSGHPSKIYLDRITAANQIKALSKILTNFFGRARRHFIIFDNEDTVRSDDGTLTSRNTAIRGILGLAKKVDFLLGKNSLLDFENLEKIASSIKKNENVCFFGFTWLVYNVTRENFENIKIRNLFKKIRSSDKLLLHIGGWKKLQDLNVSKNAFKKLIGSFVDVKASKIIDFYGMTEQLGTVYPDCQAGYKHVPLYSDLLIRDIRTSKSLKNGETGLIQFVSPIAHSYPGISILSDDIGKIVGVDDCKCGRRGKYFVFEKRAEFAELRGCGDTLNIQDES